MPHFVDYCKKKQVVKKKTKAELNKLKKQEMKEIIKRGPPYIMTGVLSKHEGKRIGIKETQIKEE